MNRNLEQFIHFISILSFAVIASIMALLPGASSHGFHLENKQTQILLLGAGLFLILIILLIIYLLQNGKESNWIIGLSRFLLIILGATFFLLTYFVYFLVSFNSGDTNNWLIVVWLLSLEIYVGWMFYRLFKKVFYDYNT
ncbi:MAG: hypothetical protein KDE26_28500 [Bacteroidetes bacterium]|nr:hypothetical protein [Bacteroidota bacterium]